MNPYKMHKETKQKSSLYNKSQAIQQAEITAKAAELAHQEKIQFLAKISHELRTPMNSIMGFTQLSMMTEKKNQDFLDKVYQSSQYLLELINNLLDVSNLESGELEIDSVVFNLPLILEELNTTARHLAKNKNISLDICRYNTHKQQELLKGDPLRLNQILSNLISNAVKFTEQGEVSLTITELEADEQERNNVLILQFIVADTGIGLTDSQKTKLQHDFFQTDTASDHTYSGSGLGLTIAKQLIEKMGGRIQVNSTPGKGSQFCFTIKFLLPSREEKENYQNTYNFQPMATVVEQESPEVMQDQHSLSAYPELQELQELITEFDTRAIDVLDVLLKQDLAKELIEYQQLLVVSSYLKQYDFELAGNCLLKIIAEKKVRDSLFPSEPL